MGKKNKKKGQSDHSAWMDSMMGKNRDIEERYGIERVRFGGKPGESGQMEAHADMKSYKDRMVEAFRNDYDARRTLEAAAMSGKKKAQKILDSGFKSVSDIRNAQNFFEKAAKRHKQGGAFTNASDFMGLTQSMVERDRSKLEDKFDDMFEQRADNTDETGTPAPQNVGFTFNDVMEQTFGEDVHNTPTGGSYSDSAFDGGFDMGTAGKTVNDSTHFPILNEDIRQMDPADAAQKVAALGIQDVASSSAMEKGRYRQNAYTKAVLDNAGANIL